MIFVSVFYQIKINKAFFRNKKFGSNLAQYFFSKPSRLRAPKLINSYTRMFDFNFWVLNFVTVIEGLSDNRIKWSTKIIGSQNFNETYTRCRLEMDRGNYKIGRSKNTKYLYFQLSVYTRNRLQLLFGNINQVENRP